MKYTTYSVEDFVADEFFQQWVKHPQPLHLTFWENWLLENPHKAGEIEEARKTILSFSWQDSRNFNQQMEKDLHSIWQKIEKIEREEEKQRPPAVQKVSFRWLGMAAAIAGLLLVGGLIFVKYLNWDDVQYATTFGKMQVVTLPDGSKVTLNSNTKLSISSDWTQNEDREVWVEGEAFFQVSRQKATNGYRKFVVHTRNLSVEVTGTRFNVNTRRKKTTVVLSEGAIQLRTAHSGQSVAMKPGDCLELSGQQTFVYKKVNPDLYSAWLHNELSFEKESLATIAYLLEDTYGYQVIFKDSTIAARRFTGSGSTQHIEQLLTKISKSHNLLITKKGKTILVDKY